MARVGSLDCNFAGGHPFSVAKCITRTLLFPKMEPDVEFLLLKTTHSYDEEAATNLTWV